VIGLQFLQLMDQHLVADALEQALELAVTRRTAAQEKQDQRFRLPEMMLWNVAASRSLA